MKTRDRAATGTYHLTGPYYLEIARCKKHITGTPGIKSTNTMVNIYAEHEDGTDATVLLSMIVTATGRIAIHASKALTPANDIAKQIANLSDIWETTGTADQ